MIRRGQRRNLKDRVHQCQAASSGDVIAWNANINFLKSTPSNFLSSIREEQLPNNSNDERNGS